MKLSKTYIETLLNKKVIPVDAWFLKYFDGKQCFMIRNENYCRVFWLDLWYNVLAEKFKNQNMISQLENIDLTLPVILDSNLYLVNAPKIIQNIDYFSSPRKQSPFYLNVSTFMIFIMYVICMVIIYGITMMFYKNSPYTYLV